MAVVRVKGRYVDVDIEAELREYDWGYNAKWTPEKLVASSPFRTDRRASFFVNLSGEYAGTWADSGAIDYEYSSGNFVKLIALLRDIDYEEAAEYLLEKYGIMYDVKPNQPIRIMPPKIYTPFQYKYIEHSPIVEATSPYLLSRGISPEIQELFGVGYDEKHRGFTAIPWRHNGRIANILYRSTRGKYFFFADDATPIKRLVFGIEHAGESAVLCEAAIDAMSWHTAGIPAIAVGGAHLSREQAEIIKRSRIKRLYLGGDNDERGRQLNKQAAELLRGYAELYEVDYGEEKDANDVLMRRGVEALRAIYNAACPVPLLQIRGHPHG